MSQKKADTFDVWRYRNINSLERIAWCLMTSQRLKIEALESENKQLKDIILMASEEYSSDGELSTKLCLEVAAMVREVIE